MPLSAFWSVALPGEVTVILLGTYSLPVTVRIGGNTAPLRTISSDAALTYCGTFLPDPSLCFCNFLPDSLSIFLAHLQRFNVVFMLRSTRFKSQILGIFDVRDHDVDSLWYPTSHEFHLPSFLTFFFVAKMAPFGLQIVDQRLEIFAEFCYMMEYLFGAEWPQLFATRWLTHVEIIV